MADYRLFSCISLITFSFNGVGSQSQETQDIHGRDCSDIWQKNSNAVSGVYLIKPNGVNAPFQVSCEMTKSGGWTLMQYRDGSGGVSFNQKWKSYEKGFGNIKGEHWLGLKKMNILTQQKNRRCKLNIQLEDFSNATAYAEYGTFRIEPRTKFYQLTIGNYSGTAGDSFKGMSLPGFNQYGRFFSTEDSPHDGCTPNCLIDDIMYESCSKIFSSGWWFNACGFANLNGYYWTVPGQEHQMSSLSWPTWREYNSLKSTKMSINCK